MATPAPSPAELLHLSTSWWLLMAETQSVVAMRLMGMAGLWSVSSGEDTRMVNEKAPALAKSLAAAATATMLGQRPDQIASAAIRPLRAKTRANSRRLARQGPKFG